MKMESIIISQRILNEEDIKQLIKVARFEITKEAIEWAYYGGLKLVDILKKLDIPRRTLQGRLSRLGKKQIGIEINFEQIRQSCMIRLINQGYTPEYITEFMGYSRKDIVQYRRRIAGYLHPKLRYKILIRDKCKCVVCGSTTILEVDHIKPVCEGGKTEENNLRTLCGRCNIGKGKQ